MKRKIDEPEVSRATLNPSGSSRVLSAVVLPGDVLLDRTSYLPLEARRISRMLPHRTPSQRARVILWHPRVPHPRNRSSKHHPNLCDPSLDILPSIHLSIVTSKHFLPLPFHSFSLSFSLSSSLSFALSLSLSLSLFLSLSFSADTKITAIAQNTSTIISSSHEFLLRHVPRSVSKHLEADSGSRL